MLRINEKIESRRNGRPRWTLEVEGALRGEWVGELRRSWRRVRDLASGASIRLELVDISYVDTGGKVLLAEMYRDGVEILTRDCLTAAIRDEIVARSTSDLRPASQQRARPDQEVTARRGARSPV